MQAGAVAIQLSCRTWSPSGLSCRRKAEADVKKAQPDAEQAEADELVFQRLQKEVDEELKLDYLVTGS